MDGVAEINNTVGGFSPIMGTDAKSGVITRVKPATETGWKTKNPATTLKSASKKPEKEEDEMDFKVVFAGKGYFHPLKLIPLCDVPSSADVARFCTFTWLATAKDVVKLRIFYDKTTLTCHSTCHMYIRGVLTEKYSGSEQICQVMSLGAQQTSFWRSGIITYSLNQLQKSMILFQWQ